MPLPPPPPPPRGNNKRSWKMVVSIVVFVIYITRMVILLDSAHHSMSGRAHVSLPADLSVLVGDMIVQRPNDPVDVLQPKERETCWTLPDEVPWSEISPKYFMEEGPGKDYLELYHKQKKAVTTGRPILNVRFALYHLLTTCQPVYYHIHRNGGTTMNVIDSPLIDAFYSKRETRMGRNTFQNETRQILHDIYNAQQRQQQYQPEIGASRDMPFFTFLRDPVKRFLSGVGEAVKTFRLEPCNQQPDTESLLDCILTTIQESGSFLDEHLAPQAFELYHGTVGLDLKIQVTDLSVLNTVITNLGFGVGAGNAPKKKKRMPLRSARRLPNYNLNVTDDSLTPAVIERICEAYKVDVELLRMTGVSKSMCHLEAV